MKYFLVALLLLTGCSTILIEDKEREVTFRARMPAWPWNDSLRAMDRLNLSAGTNRFTASIRGLTETEVTSTNAVHLLEAVTKGAMEGAVKALTK